MNPDSSCNSRLARGKVPPTLLPNHNIDFSKPFTPRNRCFGLLSSDHEKPLPTPPPRPPHLPAPLQPSLLSAPPTPPSMFDPRWELQFPSTLIYYNHDNGNPWMKGIERHQTAAAYWQQAYHTTCADLSEAVYLLQCRISDLEERFADKKQVCAAQPHALNSDVLTIKTKEEWRPISPSTPTAIKLPNDVQGNFV
ncbi:hypothetical protein BDP55DRAFT_639263 [Colletotrichum godetiae]|uniref:Uncharacterized protein n=1 Tax=Colletotrichum godetiae TaxID=1209918 RepID=A0AAJ0A888_9PEZI|nr:uncharacterized protein BDP55DRAFT_639263 [Colletotrichum godetiae]KAK1656876.1 hypothetical protein BDP55DRAFT_639263 [Colletotrichum godetiae]